jgi:VIT1/CCC1 family predicted Fe2+/Mn2+ transporter
MLAGLRPPRPLTESLQRVSAKQDIRRYRANLQGEVDSAAVYRAMAELEAQPERADVYRRLAAVEETHASFWLKQLADLSAPRREPLPGLRTRLLILIAKRFGPDVVVPTLRTLEQIDRDQYDTQPESRSTGMPAQERSHARVLSSLTGAVRTTWDGAAYSRFEGRHGAGGGNALRAAVLGANDGLVSNLSLVMGVAGAAFSNQTVLITGLAGLISGACSMALGEWLSVQSSRELYEKQIATEADELAQVPDEEKEELVLIYQSKGMDRAAAEQTAERVMAHKEDALDTLVREEIGVNPKDLGGSAWSAAAASFFVFMTGAIFPVAPFFVLRGNSAVIASVLVSGLALYATGAVTSIFTGRSVAFSGLRQLAIGLAAAAVTFGLGRLVGVSIA